MNDTQKYVQNATIKKKIKKSLHFVITSVIIILAF